MLVLGYLIYLEVFSPLLSRNQHDLGFWHIKLSGAQKSEMTLVSVYAIKPYIHEPALLA